MHSSSDDDDEEKRDGRSSRKSKEHEKENGGDDDDDKPDHGETYIPGAESSPPDDRAPRALDHFKRGYKERAELREREMSHLNADFENHRRDDTRGAVNDGGRDSSEEGGRRGGGDDHRHGPSSHGRDGESRRRDGDHRRGDGGGGGPERGDAAGHVGFEVVSLVDKLTDPRYSLSRELDGARRVSPQSFESGKAVTAILSQLARRKQMKTALEVWRWMDRAHIKRNVFHYNSLISVCEKMKDWKGAMKFLEEMDQEGVHKNEVTFSSAISACEKSGNWRQALDLLERMKGEGVPRTAIAYNAAISACEKGLVPAKALEIFEGMKQEGVRPTVVTYSALISACEKGQQWKLALEVLEDMKKAGHGANVIAYSAAISALSKGQQWEKALELFREIESSGGRPSVVTYNATMTALEKGLQWERALDLFDEMKYKNLPVTVVSYGSAISACEKGYQWRQCLDFLDEMTERRIKKNVIIFGAAMSCMEKSCRADIAFQLMDRMKLEGVSPNVHIYNSAISACARCNLWEKGLELFNKMERVGVKRDVVTYNAVLDALCSQVSIARKLFQEGVERGFYSRVSRLGTQWLELDLHFLSLGGGEVALGWWFEECLVPYLGNSSKLAEVKSIDIVTGYGKTRMRGARHGGDGMRKRVRAMLRFMNVKEIEQPNIGRIHIDKEALTAEVARNGGKIIFDVDGYRKFRSEETTANAMPNVPQVRRSKWGAPRREEDLGARVHDGGGGGAGGQRIHAQDQDNGQRSFDKHQHRGHEETRDQHDGQRRHLVRDQEDGRRSFGSGQRRIREHVGNHHRRHFHYDASSDYSDGHHRHDGRAGFDKEQSWSEKNGDHSRRDHNGRPEEENRSSTIDAGYNDHLLWDDRGGPQRKSQNQGRGWNVGHSAGGAGSARKDPRGWYNSHFEEHHRSGEHDYSRRKRSDLFPRDVIHRGGRGSEDNYRSSDWAGNQHHYARNMKHHGPRDEYDSKWQIGWREGSESGRNGVRHESNGGEYDGHKTPMREGGCFDNWRSGYILPPQSSETFHRRESHMNGAYDDVSAGPNSFSGREDDFTCGDSSKRRWQSSSGAGAYHASDDGMKSTGGHHQANAGSRHLREQDYDVPIQDTSRDSHKASSAKREISTSNAAASSRRGYDIQPAKKRHRGYNVDIKTKDSDDGTSFRDRGWQEVHRSGTKKHEKERFGFNRPRNDDSGFGGEYYDVHVSQRRPEHGRTTNDDVYETDRRTHNHRHPKERDMLDEPLSVPRGYRR